MFTASSTANHLGLNRFLSNVDSRATLRARNDTLFTSGSVRGGALKALWEQLSGRRHRQEKEARLSIGMVLDRFEKMTSLDALPGVRQEVVYKLRSQLGMPGKLKAGDIQARVQKIVDTDIKHSCKAAALDPFVQLQGDTFAALAALDLIDQPEVDSFRQFIQDTRQMGTDVSSQQPDYAKAERFCQQWTYRASQDRQLAGSGNGLDALGLLVGKLVESGMVRARSELIEPGLSQVSQSTRSPQFRELCIALQGAGQDNAARVGAFAADMGKLFAAELAAHPAHIQFSFATSDGQGFKNELKQRLSEAAKGFTAANLDHLVDAVFLRAVSRLSNHVVDAERLVIDGRTFHCIKKELGATSSGSVHLYSDGKQTLVVKSTRRSEGIAGSTDTQPGAGLLEARLHHAAMASGNPSVIEVRAAIRTPDGHLMVALEYAPHGDAQDMMNKLAQIELQTGHAQLKLLQAELVKDVRANAPQANIDAGAAALRQLAATLGRAADLTTEQALFNKDAVLAEAARDLARQYKAIGNSASDPAGIAMTDDDMAHVFALAHTASRDAHDIHAIKSRIFSGMLEALDHVHRKGEVTHLDIKPANFFMGAGFSPKLGDFGTSFKRTSCVMRQSPVLNPVWLASEVDTLYEKFEPIQNRVNKVNRDLRATRTALAATQKRIRTEGDAEQSHAPELAPVRTRDRGLVAQQATLRRLRATKKREELNIEEAVRRDVKLFTIGQKADMWSLGITLYQLVKNDTPFGADPRVRIRDDVASFIKMDDAGRYLKLGLEPDEPVHQMIVRLLDPDASKRPSAREVLASGLFQGADLPAGTVEKWTARLKDPWAAA